MCYGEKLFHGNVCVSVIRIPDRKERKLICGKTSPRLTQNESNNTKMMKWRCVSNEQETVSLDNAFAINVYLYAFVNAVSAIVGLVSNSLVINGVYRNKMMNKVSRTLTILLPIAGLVSSLVIQPLYVSSKIIILLDIQSDRRDSYCALITIVAHGTKIFVAFSIVIMLGITAERYMAVIYPIKYITHKHDFLKVLLIFQVILPTHFILSIIWPWYQNFSKIITAFFTLMSYLSTIYAYGKIYLKLRRLDRVWASSREGTGDSGQTRKKNKTLMAFLVVGVYFVCYLPMVVSRSLNFDRDNAVVQLYFRPWFATFLFCSFSVNALVYGWRSARLSKVVAHIGRGV